MISLFLAPRKVRMKMEEHDREHRCSHSNIRDLFEGLAVTVIVFAVAISVSDSVRNFFMVLVQ